MNRLTEVFVFFRSESVDETERRKSYNYRVVMFMDGKEIDMPGRCSAGQKVSSMFTMSQLHSTGNV